MDPLARDVAATLVPARRAALMDAMAAL